MVTRYSIGPALCAAALLCGAAALCGTAAFAENVTTYHYDNLRTGWNPNETVLTPRAVLLGAVGDKRFKMTSFSTLDSQVDTQPLIVTGQTIKSGVRDVVYVTTENNSVYALDANTGQVLLRRGLGTPVPMSELPGGCNSNAATLGIGGTAVIDLPNNTMYVIAYVDAKNGPEYALHELNLSTLTDVVPRVLVGASGKLSDGTSYRFNAAVSRQRAALLLASGNVYAGFASFCDFDANESRGWVLGWQTGSLTPLASNELANRLATSPRHYFLSSVWMSGYGLAASPSGDVYFVTGNSDHSGTTIDDVDNVAESVVQMSADLSAVKSVFTPDTAATLEAHDGDFGAGGALLLPPQAHAASGYLVAAGKDGNMYFLNADNLNNHKTGADRILGSYAIGRCWCGQSYFTDDNGAGRIVSSGGSSAILWTVKNRPHPELIQGYKTDAISGNQDPGFFTAVSSNGTLRGTQVIWAVSRPAGDPAEDISLYAFNAASGATVFTGVAGTWPNVNGNANIAPVVANGKVYVASFEGLAIFGLSSGPAATIPAGLAPVPAARPALAAGVHEIYGTVSTMDDTTVTVIKRDGTRVTVDTQDAVRNFAFAEPTVGHGILVRGIFDDDGVMRAQAALHAKDNPVIWPPDR